MTEDNPFARPWTTPFGVPPFAEIRAEHFRPAFDAAIAEHQREIEAIATHPEGPTFANTIEAMERAGEALDRVGGVFWNLTGTMSDDALRAIERDMSPILARHRSAIRLDPRLFARVDAVFRAREAAGLTAEQKRLVERTRLSFARAGAALGEADRKRLGEITERLATLGTRFSQNVLKDETAFALLLEHDDDLGGLSEAFLSSAAALATDRGHPGKHAVSLSRGAVETFLTQSTRRDLREKLLRAFLARGQNGGETDNREVIAETLRLRDERARLLGYANYADFKLDDTMAGSADAVYDLLDKVWSPARDRALRDRDRLREMIAADGGNFELAPHDWRHYAEKLRKAEFDIDDASLRPHFPLDRVIEAAFFVANRLFGLRFVAREDIALYHPDARAFEVIDANGRHVGVFIGDYFARPSKRGGAWMSAFRGQRNLDERRRPIIVNVLNVSKPAEGEPALLSLTEASTLFHEFGHALHGLLSDVVYPSLAGTSVDRDFVELPSQLYEHWLLAPEVLGRFAHHVETGEPLAAETIERLRASRTFGQGFETVEFCSSAFFDMDAHRAAEVGDPLAIESATLARIRNPAEIPMRHRAPHFSHAFAGEGYAAGYYSYLWAATLDQDAFAAFEETGDVFDPDLARRLHDHVYAAGNSRPPRDAYVAFRGRLPDVQPLLKARGFA